jgi:hypothetical protein
LVPTSTRFPWTVGVPSSEARSGSDQIGSPVGAVERSQRLVSAPDDHPVPGHGRGGEVGLLGCLSPEDLPRVDRDRHAGAADVRREGHATVGDDRGRDVGLVAEGHGVANGARGAVHDPEHAVAAAEDHRVPGDGGGAVQVVVGLRGPEALPGGGVHRVELAVVASDQDRRAPVRPASEHGAPEDPLLGLVGPDLLPGVRVDGIELPVGGADVDAAVGHERRGLDVVAGGERPDRLPGLGVDAVEAVVVGPDEDPAAATTGEETIAPPVRCRQTIVILGGDGGVSGSLEVGS